MRFRLLVRGCGWFVDPSAIHDQVNLRPIQFEIAQQNARAEETQYVDRDPQRSQLRIRRFARRFAAMQNHAICFALELQQIPVERRQSPRGRR